MSQSNKEPIIIVSGLPRSGTSLMMQLLQAAGVELLIDNKRTGDTHNPRGYFELEAVKQLEHSSEFLKGANGKAVKIVSHLLQFLPDSYQYQIILMHRDLKAVIQSQNKMLHLLGKKNSEISEDDLALVYQTHLAMIANQLHRKANVQVLNITFEDLFIKSEVQIKKIGVFLTLDLPREKMQKVIEANLKHH